jgi:protein TonB
MGYLVIRSTRSNCSESRPGGGARGWLAPGMPACNRSSLAIDTQLDVQQGGSLAWRPIPQLVRSSAAPSVSNGILSHGGVLYSAQKDPKSKAISLVVHSVIIGGILWLGLTSKTVVHSAENVVRFSLTDPPPPVMTVAKQMGGGGGGGAHHVVPPVKAQLPKPLPAPHIHLMPAQIAQIVHPKLAAEPDTHLNMQVNTNMPTMGMPDSPQVALASQGAGAHSGFGAGMGGGIGIGHGSGTGVGSGGGYGGGIMSVGGGVSAPVVIHQAEAEFTEEARKANFQGTVSLQLIVDQQGNPQDVRVVRHAGMGLDEKAIEAVQQYKFRPAMYQGHPVAVQMIIDVDFRLH